jgi:hypothetical protein
MLYISELRISLNSTAEYALLLLSLHWYAAAFSPYQHCFTFCHPDISGPALQYLFYLLYERYPSFIAPFDRPLISDILERRQPCRNL